MYNPSNSQWTWISGLTTSNANGAYGPKGSGSTLYYPGARQIAASWVDNSGNFWIFGGLGYDSVGTNSSLGDLWMFNPSNLNWIYVAGTNLANQTGTCGAMGVPSTTYFPGTRYNVSSFYDSGGNLWLFGGAGYDCTGNFGSLSDLWEFVPGTGTWNWVSGNNVYNHVATYGTQGVPSAGNIPGGRSEPAFWMDAAGTFWFFAGAGYNAVGFGILNDMWSYSPTSGLWTWVSGPAALFTPGSYGTRGVPSSTNVPGARDYMATWQDQIGNVYIFSGTGRDSTGSQGDMNDFWEYSPSTRQWQWLGGSNVISQSGVFGTQNGSNLSLMPGSRHLSQHWTDKSGNFWLFGGVGYDISGTVGYLSDMWILRP